MKFLVQVKTPKGCAESTNKNLRKFIIGKSKIANIYISKDDDEFYWEIDGTVKDYMKAIKNVSMFDSMVKGIFTNKWLRKAVNKAISKEDQAQLDDMLHNHTTIDILKEPTGEELTEHYDTTWEKIKSGFRRFS